MAKTKLLVVDDEESIRDVLQQLFKRSGYTVRLAESGEEGLQIALKENIHVIFLDLNLPGMNGIELCRKIRQERPMAIIHAVTGYPSIFELSDCREAGFDDYFTKPVNLAWLSRATQIAFEKIERWVPLNKGT